MILNFEPGDKVINPMNRDWGVGQVQTIINEKDGINIIMRLIRACCIFTRGL